MQVFSSGAIFLIDDHPIVRAGLRALIEEDPRLSCIGEADSAEAALRLLPSLTPDVVLVDLSLKGANGLELVKGIVALRPELRVLVLSMHDEQLYAERALEAGARGYVMKDNAPEQLRDAIHNVLAGQVHLSPAMTTAMLERSLRGVEHSSSPRSLLSDRELEVFERLGEGLPTRQVAEALHLSVKTIESHRASIKKKLGLSNANELVRQAVLFKEGLR